MPSWTKEQLTTHPYRDALLGPVLTTIPANSQSETTNLTTRSFTVPGIPVPKPRMSQRDTWKKRPCVLRYRDYCDRCRAASGPLPPEPPLEIKATAYLPMPKSWSKKKQLAMRGKPHRQRPDSDNITKSVCDALFAEDSTIYHSECTKFWCYSGNECTQVVIVFCSLDWHPLRPKGTEIPDTKC